jgi:holo-[acyl-carrier protein] synthase
MILGIGTDITSIDRFNSSRQHMDRMAGKILTDFELKEYSALTEHHGKFLAKRWAVKEAVSKAFGTGISGDTRWKSIELRHNTHTGAPFICFYHQLNNSVETLGAKCHITLSDEGNMTAAFAVIEYNTKV